MNLDKTMNVILYILHKIGEISKTKLIKLIFFADFEHLKKYNRPITWDKYYRLDGGPVPSYLLDLINIAIGRKGITVSKRDKECFLNAVKITKRAFGRNEGAFLSPLRKPDIDEISESDIEIIDYILRKYGHFNARELSVKSHEHIAYKRSSGNRIKYSDGLLGNKKRKFFKVWEDEIEGIRNMYE